MELFILLKNICSLAKKYVPLQANLKKYTEICKT